ncbi:MAG: YIP1 family protein [Myxococcota bacterium]|nr:YIP1 family protein [Myxococcota bacterium]
MSEAEPQATEVPERLGHEAAPAADAPPHRSFPMRLVGALRLDSSVYDEIARDDGALGQAALVAVLGALGLAIGTASIAGQGTGLLAGITVLFFWLSISALVTALGRFYGHTAELPPILRVLGFASAPFFLRVADVIPSLPVHVAIRFFATALLIATYLVAIRQALGVTTGRAAFILVVSVLVLVFFLFLYLSLLGT